MLERIDAQGCCLGIIHATAFAPELREGESIHRELRPTMQIDYGQLMASLIAEGCVVTHLVDENDVRAFALWRHFGTTYAGRRLEIDDLVTASGYRSRAYGRTMIEWLERRAIELSCSTLTLNSAVHRADAHRFYFGRRFRIFGFHFTKNVS